VHGWQRLKSNSRGGASGDDHLVVVPEGIVLLGQQVRHRVAGRDVGEEPERVLQVGQQGHDKVELSVAIPERILDSFAKNERFGQSRAVPSKGPNFPFQSALCVGVKGSLLFRPFICSDFWSPTPLVQLRFREALVGDL
jgi:hypothetical protein